MKRTFSFCIVILSFGLLFSNELIDDFERGGKKNYRNLDWYYFSDGNDGGNSVILNADTVKAWVYTDFKPVKEGQDSGYCAKLEYTLGDNRESADSANYVGIGTDLAPQGTFVDLRTVYGIRFMARSDDPVTVFFELVTSNIDDWCFYQADFEVTNQWKTFYIDFNDRKVFKQPYYMSYRNKKPLILSEVQKMNWQISTHYNYSNTNCLYLDNVILLDSSKVHVNFTPYKLQKRIAEPKTYDLNGRFIQSNEFILPYGIVEITRGSNGCRVLKRLTSLKK